MAYITQEELNTVLYEYQLDEIAEGDTDIIMQNIAAAEAEVRGYLASAYDVATIFSQTGNARNPLLMEIVKSVTLWYVIRLSNVDILYSKVKDRYDRAVTWLKAVAEGTISPELPPLTNENGDPQYRFKLGSNNKFKHTY